MRGHRPRGPRRGQWRRGKNKGNQSERIKAAHSLVIFLCQEAPGLGAAPGPGPGVPRILTVESPPPAPAQDKKVTHLHLHDTTWQSDKYY